MDDTNNNENLELLKFDEQQYVDAINSEKTDDLTDTNNELQSKKAMPALAKTSSKNILHPPKIKANQNK